MKDDQKKFFNYLYVAGFSLYFLILFIERVLAVIFSVRRGGEYALTSGNVFNYFAYAVTAVSLLLGTVFFVRLFLSFGRSVKQTKEYDFSAHSREWVIGAILLLFGGMMHTGFTLAGVQFAAYGFLIGAFIVKCIEECLAGKDAFVAIVSTVYLVLFSMSIPVCYLSFTTSPLRELFFVSEFAAVFALVPIFGILSDGLMRKGRTSFSPVYPSVMAFLSGATLAFEWTEKINTFVLIFAGLTLLCYLTFGIVAMRREKPFDAE